MCGGMLRERGVGLYCEVEMVIWACVVKPDNNVWSYGSSGVIWEVECSEGGNWEAIVYVLVVRISVSDVVDEGEWWGQEDNNLITNEKVSLLKTCLKMRMQLVEESRYL